MRRALSSLSVVVFAFALTACSPDGGGGGPGDPTPNPTNGNNDPTYNDQQAGYAAGGLRDSTHESVNFYRFDSSEAPDPGGFAGPTACDPVVTGDASDPDLDGYPNDVTSSFDCSFGVIVHRGLATIQDTRPNTAAFAFHAEAEVESAVEDVRSVVEATLDADENAGTYTLDLTDLLVSTETGPTVASVSGNSFMSFTPYNAWTPEMGELTDGELTLDGNWDIGVSGVATVSADVETITPLVLDPLCDTEVVSGEIKGSADIETGGVVIHEEFQIKWNDCDDVTASYNGDSVLLP